MARKHSEKGVHSEQQEHRWQIGDLGHRTAYQEDRVSPVSIFVIKEILSPSVLLVCYPQRNKGSWVFFTHDEHDRVLGTDECRYMSQEKYAEVVERFEAHR